MSTYDPGGQPPPGQQPQSGGRWGSPQPSPAQEIQPYPPQQAPTGYPQGPQNPYGYGPPVVGPPRTNGMAVASLVFGILWIWWLGSILALVFGYVGKSQIDQSMGTQGGRGLAIAGIVLGWIGVGTFLLLFLLPIFFAAVMTTGI